MSNPQPLSLVELKALIPRLQSTVQQLIGNGRVGAAAGSGRAANRRARAARGRGDGEKAREKLIATLRGAKGLQLKEVVKRSGLDAGAAQYHLRALRAQKKARVVGSRKEARWFAA